MATLILEHADHRRGAVLNGRVVIGRRANNHIAIRDRSVSRIHAWIGKSPDGYFIADSGSRTGTKLNGEFMRGRKPLADGDEIQIGPARIIFHSNGALPADIETLDLANRVLTGDDGIFLDCECGAPIWVPWDFAGRAGRCRDCDRLVQLPNRPGAGPGADASNDTMAPGMSATVSRRTAGSMRVAPSIDAVRLEDDTLSSPQQDEEFPRSDRPETKPAPETFCGACQSSVSMLEETVHCPECGVAFHADCWRENGGCSSYGCKQVGILARPTPDAVVEGAVVPTPDVRPVVEEPAVVPARARQTLRPVQWGYLLLPSSLLAALVSIRTFGVPSLLLALGIVIYEIRHVDYNRKVVGFALLVSIIAAAAGSGFSTYWWLASPARSILRP